MTEVADNAAGPRARARTRTIAVWGHFHGGNLGDELVVAVLLDAIRARRPDARLLCVSMSPQDTERRHGVPTLPINTRPIVVRPRHPDTAPGGTARGGPLRALARKVPGASRARALVTALLREPSFLFRSYRALREVDQVVVAGSGQLLDAWRGPWEHPLTTFGWALLARLAGTEVLYPSIGAGPIDGRLSAFLIRTSVRWARFISVRDEDSARVLHGIGVRRPLPVRPDMGWAYTPVDDDPPGPPEVAPWRVGLNVMSHEDPRYLPGADERRYRSYLAKMATFTAVLLERGHEVVVFSSHSRADPRVADDLRVELVERGLAADARLVWATDEIESIDDLVRAVRRCDYVVAGRFHSVLLPQALGVPTLALAYHPKTRELMAQVGWPTRCVDVDEFEVPDLVAAFDSLTAEDGPEQRRKLRERVNLLRAGVVAQFDELLGPDVAARDS